MSALPLSTNVCDAVIHLAAILPPLSDKNQTPPVHPEDEPVASDMYSSSKIEAERIVYSSGLKYSILRLDARCEMVLDVDVAHALVSACEKNGCRLTNWDLLSGVFTRIILRWLEKKSTYKK